jgi:hypothetical protein
MFRACVGVVLAVAAVGSAADPQPMRFKFQPGQVLTYSVKQQTTVTETAHDEVAKDLRTGTTVTKLALTRRWEVKAVDAAGVTTLEMSITALRQEIARPGPADKDGMPTVDTLVIDSATPEGQQQTAEYLNKPIVTVKLDPRGRLVEAKAVAGTTDRLAAELPFRLTLPETPLAVGATWDRPFVIKLDPPLGTGETHDAIQTYTLKSLTGGVATITVASALNATPKDPAQLPPLTPLLWEGEVSYDPANGRYTGAKLSVKREVPNHQGEGTKFVYESAYTETLEK